jgi:hypothetical protein
MRQARNRGEHQLIAGLVAGHSVREAAALANMSESTAYARLRKSEFRRLVAEAKAAVVQATVAKLSSAAGELVELLMEVARNKKAPASARVSAMRAGLEFGFRGNSAGNFEDRLAEVEERMRKTHGDPRAATGARRNVARTNGEARGPKDAGGNQGGPGLHFPAQRNEAGSLAGGSLPKFP